MKRNLIVKYIIAIAVLSLAPCCVLFPKSKNKYKHFEGKVVSIKLNGSMYKSDSTITHTMESYVISGLNQFPDHNSKYIPVGTEMHVDKMKHVRTIDSDYWYAAGSIYIDGKMYNVGYDSHHSYLEVKK